MSRELRRSSLRVYPETLESLYQVADYLIAAAANGHRKRFWRSEESPSHDEVIAFLVAFWNEWRARRKKAGAKRRKGNKVPPK